MKIEEDENVNLKQELDEKMEKIGEETVETFDEDSMDDDPTRGVEFERLVNDEYKYWKSQTPFLYDLVISHSMEWPSLTVEWLPDRIKSSEGPYSVQKLALGTHTKINEPNYLIIAQVKLPLLDDHSCDEEYGNLDGEDDRSQLVSGTGCKIEIKQKIPHDGEVHKARHMPQDPSIIATKTNAFEVHIFDLKNHPVKPPVGGISNPDLRLTGHNTYGFGLSWSKFKQGILLSGDDDSTICLWDINQVPLNNRLHALQSFKVHKSEVEDVAWHLKHDYLFGSCGADRYLHIHDFRSPCVKKPIQQLMAHKKEIRCLSFNPYNEWLVATGSTDMTVKIFDMRKFTSPIHDFHHRNEVCQVWWSPHNEMILASSSFDRRVLVWDTSRVGQEQTSLDAEDGPPELLFMHGGHTDRIPDFSWNPTEDMLFASVADDNMLQVWQMADHIYIDESDQPADNIISA